MATEAEQQKALMERKRSLAFGAAKQMAQTLSMQGKDPEQWAGAVTEAIIRNPDIIKCDELSFAKAIRDCCTMGLVPDGTQAALVPFKGQATMLPMVGGLKKVVHEVTGTICRSKTVRKQDKFTYRETEKGVEFEHEPNLFAEGDNPIVAAWAAITVKGQTAIRVITITEIDEAEKHSPKKDGSVWRQHRAAMAEKTAVHRLMREHKYLIYSQGQQERVDAVVNSDIEPTEAIDVTPAAEAETGTEKEEKPPKAPRKNGAPRKQAAQPAATTQEPPKEPEAPAAPAEPPPPTDDDAPPDTATAPAKDPQAPIDFSQPIDLGGVGGEDMEDL